jgi:hypothetical protein
MIQEDLSGDYKFNNCIYRSEHEEKTIVHRCKCRGGNYEDSGYRCSAKSIFKIVPEICQFCNIFQKKS